MSDRRRPSQFFTFPDPVNETSARLVAAGVVLQGVVFLAVRQWWVLVPLVFGFAARVAAGPRFSLLGRAVTQFVTPRLRRDHRMVSGPPKRFAQAIGLTFSASALIAELLGGNVVAIVLIAGLVVAAALESFVGLCLGCMAFQRLMQWGVIPQSVCVSCNDIGASLNAG